MQKWMMSADTDRPTLELVDDVTFAPVDGVEKLILPFNSLASHQMARTLMTMLNKEFERGRRVGIQETRERVANGIKYILGE